MFLTKEERLIKNIFLSSNSWEGFTHLYNQILPKMDRVIILKGGPASGKSTFIKSISSELVNLGIAVDLVHCSLDTKALDGVIIPKYKIAIVDGAPPHDIEPYYYSLKGEIVNLGDYQDKNILNLSEDKIHTLSEKLKEYYSDSLEQLTAAKELSFWIEQLYLEGLKSETVTEITLDLIQEIFINENTEENNYLLGAFTSKGIIHFINGLTNNCSSRYILKGKPDKAKSKILEIIAEIAVKRKMGVDIYRNYLEPKKIDMIIIPQISTAVIDGSTYHIINPSKQGDYIVNINRALNLEVLEKNIGMIQSLEEELEGVLNKAVGTFSLAEDVYDEIKKTFVIATDFEKVALKRTEVLGEILREISSRR